MIRITPPQGSDYCNFASECIQLPKPTTMLKPLENKITRHEMSIDNDTMRLEIVHCMKPSSEDLKTKLIMENHSGFTGLFRVTGFSTKIEYMEQDISTMNNWGVLMEVVVIVELRVTIHMGIFVVIIDHFSNILSLIYYSSTQYVFFKILFTFFISHCNESFTLT